MKYLFLQLLRTAIERDSEKMVFQKSRQTHLEITGKDLILQ